MPDEPKHRYFSEADWAFAKAITYFRSLAGLTQHQIGECIGLTGQQYQRYEHGVNRVTVGRVIQIADALQVPPEVLIEMSRGKRDWHIDRDAGRLMQAFRRLHKPSTQSQLVQFAERLARLEGAPPERN